MKPEESWLRQQKGRARPWLGLSILAGWAGVMVLALQAWLLAGIVTAIAFDGQDLASQQRPLLTLLALLPLRALLIWGSAYLATRAAVALKQQLRTEFFDHLRRLGPAWLAGRHSGSLITALSDGIEALGGYYSRYLPATAQMAAVPLTLLLFIAPKDWLSALILLATAPLIPFFMILIGKGAEGRNQRQWRQLARMSAHLLDVIRGLPTLKLFDASRREAEVVARISDEYRRRTLSVLRIAFLSSFTLEFFATVSIAVVAVVIGFRLYWGEMEFVQGFFVLLLAPEFYLPLRSLGSAYHDRMEAIGAAEQLLEVQQAEPAQSLSGNRAFVPLHGKGIGIELREVAFRWPDGRVGLDGLDLAIGAGERIAIVGPSGAGKSTLMHLLLGFLQPDSGEILVDGQPLARLDAASWRSQLAWVPQSPHLFQGTLRQNITLALPGADSEAVREAARRAHCLEFIERLPLGLDTPVGEGGQGLSGGQRQRIALARVFLRRAKLVLLDEPTANLDLVSERYIQQAVEEMAGECTLITIAHRLHTVRNADRILVLEKGRLVQQGSHAELATQAGLYAELVGSCQRKSA
ncbi:MAG: thiol reductant ABC exporter subunit CydD [Gammaproteobacteria bacterium]|nr:MAG: thiol reductant ABC exporter subunit CydD [Gammaproteobacteria bacterium]